MKRLQDRQRGNFGADPLCQGDAVLGSLPGEFRPIGRYQEVGVHRSLLLAPSCASELESSSREPRPGRRRFLPALGIRASLRRCAQRAGEPERSVTSQVVRLAAYEKRHRLSRFQRCFDELSALNNLDPQMAATPLNAEAEVAPIWRQLRVERYPFAVQRQACET